MLTLRNFNSNISKPNFFVKRNFGVSTLCPSWWKRALEKPYNISEKAEETRAELFLKQFESRKGISADVYRTFPNRLSIKELFTVDGLKKTLTDFQYREKLLDQRYVDQRVDTLGPDLAAAHFIVHRGGKIRFKGKTTWEKLDEDDLYELPNVYEPDYLVEEIDASKMEIMYDGLQNLENLNFLKSFNASHCPRLDDWCMDRISWMFSENIKELDISNCPRITGKGLETVVKLRKLKTLKVFGLDQIQNAKLICLLLEEGNPQLEIKGINY